MTTVNPTTRTFGKYAPLATAEVEYQRGFEVGLTWKSNWVPGGPMSFTGYETDKPDWIAFCNATQENRREWLKGWKDGLIKQNPNHSLLTQTGWIDRMKSYG